MTEILGIPENRLRPALARVGLTDLSSEEVGESFSRMAWSALTEPGDRVAGQLVYALGAAEALQALINRDNTEILSERLRGVLEDSAPTAQELNEAQERWMPRLNSGGTLSVLDRTGKVGGWALLPTDPLWPEGLRDLGFHAPHVLWCRGQRTALAALPRSLAVVGARASTGYGEHVTMELAAGLVDRNVAIVSGAAYGIDGMAHRAALASEGMTLAFLAGGVDRFYPSGHDALLGRIVETGLILAETPCGAAPTKWRFLQRNRLIAAATPATLVVEAGWRSGSLNTANHAATLGRPLGAVPGPVTSASSAGCHRLLREFDAVCVTTAAEAVELLPNTDELPLGAGAAATAEDELSKTALRVLDALSARKQHTVDELAQLSGLSSRDVTSGLGELELEQRARLGDRGWRRA
jgi:DNA processing protein